MFDFHLHSKVSYDSTAEPSEIISAAKVRGLKEICFTDHYDFNSNPEKGADLFTPDEYSKAYDNLTDDALKIRRGVEFGLTEWNQPQLEELLNTRNFDFVIGSVHYVGGNDPYSKEYWEGLTQARAFERYLEAVYGCVKVHENFDVLGHLTYVCKSEHNPNHAPLQFSEYSDITDEIMKILVSRGIGMEINTSGVDKIGEFLPQKEFLQRFKELGGETVTVGSDAHDGSRVGQYCPQALEILKDIFGYVCTFKERKPVFHKL